MNNPLKNEHVLQALHLHKLGLKMQNDALSRAYTDLDATFHHYVQRYEFAPVAFLTLAENGRILSANHSASDLLGIARETLLDTPFAKYLCPEAAAPWQLFFNNAQKQAVRQHRELSLRRNDGRVLTVSLACCNVVSANAPIMLLCLTDLTERLTQEETRRVAAAAFESEDGMIVTDADKNILRLNKAFSRITGYSASEAIGNKPTFLHSGKHDAAFYQRLWSSVAEKGYWQGEIWDKHKNGTIFPLSLTVTAVIDTDTQTIHYVGAFRDISAEKQIETALTETRIRLENQVSDAQMALLQSTKEVNEINTALKVLLQQQKSDKEEAQTALLHEVEATVLPFLKKLKGASTGRRQSTRLIDIIESNLMTLVASYGHAETFSSALKHMTPTQVQVAALIRQGLPTKTIASTLDIAPATISVHRKQIRKKLGLESKSDNLQVYLKSLSD